MNGRGVSGERYRQSRKILLGYLKRFRSGELKNANLKKKYALMAANLRKMYYYQ